MVWVFSGDATTVGTPRYGLGAMRNDPGVKAFNSEDQGTIRAALPDMISGLASVLPSLRTGEGIVSGESVVLPARVILDLPKPQPDAADPSLAPWRKQPSTPDVRPAVAAWRGTFGEASDD